MRRFAVIFLLPLTLATTGPESFVTCQISGGKNKACLPSFNVIGQQKCGTSALYVLLKQHPQVALNDKKESMHFGNANGHNCDDARVHTYLSTFNRLLPTEHKLTGDFTSSDLSCLCCPAVVQPLLPKLRLITLLRHPIMRAQSRYDEQKLLAGAEHALRNQQHGGLGTSFEEYSLRALPVLSRCLADAIRLFGVPSVQLLARARCASNDHIIGWSVYEPLLANWMERFPRRAFLFVQSESLDADPLGVLRRVEAFLGLPEYDGYVGLDLRQNTLRFISQAAEGSGSKVHPGASLWGATITLLGGHMPINSSVSRQLAKFYASEQPLLRQIVRDQGDKENASAWLPWEGIDLPFPPLLYAPAVKCALPNLPKAVNVSLGLLDPAVGDAWLLCYDPPPYGAGSVGHAFRSCMPGVRGTCVRHRDTLEAGKPNMGKLLLWKEVLIPEHVAGYSWLALWDSDVMPAKLSGRDFNFTSYVRAMNESVGVSQPLIGSNHHWLETKFNPQLHLPLDSRLIKPGGSRCLRQSTACSVEQMCPVYSRRLWRCVWSFLSPHKDHQVSWGLGNVLHPMCLALNGLHGYYVAQVVQHIDTGTLNTSSNHTAEIWSKCFYYNLSRHIANRTGLVFSWPKALKSGCRPYVN